MSKLVSTSFLIGIHKRMSSLSTKLISHQSICNGAYSGWKNKPTQYHIQTDEGKSRYFRYQTYNGQYRKERRLDDGTVVGSYGWVDPTGMLRMTDYIADSKGYRVVKELMEYVGTNAITVDEKPRKNKKYYSAPKKKPVRGVKYPFSSVKTSTTTGPTKFHVKKSVGPTESGDEDINSLEKKKILRNRGRRVGVRNGTKAVLVRRRVSNGAGGVKFINRRPAPEILAEMNNQSDIKGFNSSAKSNVFGPYTIPLTRNKTGFIYKIPNQYHREETESDGSRRGSFGYVDPFGIRRVIHYDAGLRGFQHQKDFKFVGRQY